MNNANDGATKVPEQISVKGECMGRHKHSWRWKAGTFTNPENPAIKECSTCGTEKEVKLGRKQE